MRLPRATTIIPNGSPAKATVGSPAKATVGSPAKATVGSPAKATVGSPAKATVGSPAKATVGSPAKATAASRGNSHTDQRCLRTFVAFKMTNLLFVAIVVQLPKARFSLRK